MNCIKCKHLKIKFNKDIKNSEYCCKFGAFINTIKEKIDTNKIECFEEGKNDITEYMKRAAETYGNISKIF